MFSTQNWKQALGLMALGSFFTIIGLLLSPVTAQRDNFNEIECTKLTVVDADGKAGLILGITEHGGNVAAFDKDGKAGVRLGAHNGGGNVRIVNSAGVLFIIMASDPVTNESRILLSKNTGGPAVFLRVAEDVGRLDFYDSRSTDLPLIMLAVSDTGGVVSVRSRVGKGTAALAIGDDNSGIVVETDGLGDLK